MKNVLDRTTSRKVFVCVKKGCGQCSSSETDIPGDCPFKILHLLETNAGGIQAKRRRCGKTTQIVAMANDLAKGGYHVYIVTISMDMAQLIERQYGLRKGIIVASERQGATRFRGMAPGYVLFDEIMPDQVEAIMRVMVGSRLVAAYYTPR